MHEILICSANEDLLTALHAASGAEGVRLTVCRRGMEAVRSPWPGGFARASSSLSFPMAAGHIWAPTSSGESRMNQISPQELKARLDRRDAIVLLDVRRDWETTLCRLEKAGHIPVEEIE